MVSAQKTPAAGQAQPKQRNTANQYQQAIKRVHTVTRMQRVILVDEPLRPIDLIRTGKMTEVIGNMKTVNDAGNKYYYFAPQMEPIKNNYKPYKIWMPVPKREREVNKNLSQNPGYTQTI